VVTCQPQIRRRSGKVRQSKTNVLTTESRRQHSSETARERESCIEQLSTHVSVNGHLSNQIRKIIVRDDLRVSVTYQLLNLCIHTHTHTHTHTSVSPTVSKIVQFAQLLNISYVSTYQDDQYWVSVLILLQTVTQLSLTVKKLQLKCPIRLSKPKNSTACILITSSQYLDALERSYVVQMTSIVHSYLPHGTYGSVMMVHNMHNMPVHGYMHHLNRIIIISYKQLRYICPKYIIFSNTESALDETFITIQIRVWTDLV